MVLCKNEISEAELRAEQEKKLEELENTLNSLEMENATTTD